jgi:hypothetical protein
MCLLLLNFPDVKLLARFMTCLLALVRPSHVLVLLSLLRQPQLLPLGSCPAKPSLELTAAGTMSDICNFNRPEHSGYFEKTTLYQ